MSKKFLSVLSIILACILADPVSVSAATSVSAPSAHDAGAPVPSSIVWQDIGRGAQLARIHARLFDSVQSVSVLRYPAKRLKMHIINDPGPDADSTGALATRHRALAAVNGSYFNVRKLTPVTFVKERRRVEGRTTSGETFRTDGLLLADGHDVRITYCDTLNYDNATKSCKYALAAGPVLLIGGWEARDEWPSGSFYTKRHPRTIVGTSSDGWVYLVVIDGRAPGEADGATIHEAALIARLLGIEDAINLDGGGSSTLWTKSDGVVSYPCDNRQYDHLGQRKVPNVVIIR